MSSDFIFVDPNKIPPRRSVKDTGSRNVKLRRLQRFHESFDSDNDDEEAAEIESPEFVLNPKKFQIHFASHNPKEPTEKQAREDIDPLTEEILFVPRPRPLPTPPPVFEFKNEEASVSNVPEEAVQASAEILGEENSRDAILAELERIDSADAELFKKIKRLNVPKRSERVNLAGSFYDEIKKNVPPGI